jgi:class 3 adenylate cyclase
LFCYQEFRDLFSEEYIGADVHLAVGEQVILFTDIVGSTRLYLDRGDPQAFAAVRRHFTEVFAVVDEHQGAVVKTIGDATMAAFSDTAQAVAAARELHERFPVGTDDGDITLRVSINTGVCIAVNLNSNIDYFGNAVNLAAKLQLLAGAGDIVISEDAWHAVGVQAYAEREGISFEPVAFDFDALGETVTAYRAATVEGAAGRRKAG